MILTEKKIAIVSGEGENGTAELYGGALSERAIRSRLTRERCHGDRWARAIQWSHDNAYGEVGYDLETGEPCTWPEID
jgi:hypothetical protein